MILYRILPVVEGLGKNTHTDGQIGWLVGFYGISTFLGYLIQDTVYSWINIYDLWLNSLGVGFTGGFQWHVSLFGDTLRPEVKEFGLVVWVLWYVSLCRLFKAKSIFMKIVSSISNKSV